jgi:hypothetical protein
MNEYTLKPVEEVARVFEQIDALFDAQIKALLDQNPNLDALGVIEHKKFEMAGDLDRYVPDSETLAREAPVWSDGYRYGLLRGYWRALSWVLSERHDGYDLLEEID